MARTHVLVNHDEFASCWTCGDVATAKVGKGDAAAATAAAADVRGTALDVTINLCFCCCVLLLLLLPCSFLSLGPPGLLFFRKLGTGILPPPLEELDSVVEASEEVSEEHYEEKRCD